MDDDKMFCSEVVVHSRSHFTQREVIEMTNAIIIQNGRKERRRNRRKRSLINKGSYKSVLAGNLFVKQYEPYIKCDNGHRLLI
jgi:hypothetical protein